MTGRLGTDYYPGLRRGLPLPLGQDAAPRRARDEAEPAPRVGLADQIRDYLGRFSAADFVAMLSREDADELRQALADVGEDEIGNLTGEDDLDPNDATRAAGAMPRNAMDKALRLHPHLASNLADDDSHSDHQRAGGYHRSNPTDATLELAKKLAPGLELHPRGRNLMPPRLVITNGRIAPVGPNVNSLPQRIVRVNELTEALDRVREARAKIGPRGKLSQRSSVPKRR